MSTPNSPSFENSLGVLKISGVLQGSLVNAGQLWRNSSVILLFSQNRFEVSDQEHCYYFGSSTFPEHLKGKTYFIKRAVNLSMKSCAKAEAAFFKESTKAYTRLCITSQSSLEVPKRPKSFNEIRWRVQCLLNFPYYCGVSMDCDRSEIFRMSRFR